ncbi:MAG: glycosyl hydrolase [Cytophagales bacterium]|nr:glycosyl hydrolase [Cytophagales bacterium]
MNENIKIFAVVLISIIVNLSCSNKEPQKTSESLLESFKNPPNSAKPRVWWHWMNGNITKNGIQKDLDWMHKTGIGGFQNFDANLFTPVVVEKKLVFMDSLWKDAFKYTTELADSLNLEMAIAGSPGWSVTGGPWVAPEDGMKKFVWTETVIKGGDTFTGALPKPSDLLSNFQDVAIEEAGITGGFIGERPSFYQDAAVIAYRLPNSEKSLVELNPKVTSSGGIFNLKSLTDSDLNTTTFLPPKEPGENIWIQYEFETPQTFQSLAVVGARHTQLELFNGSPENRSLQVSDDGINFREAARIHGSLVPQTTISFPPTTAKYFRFSYETLTGEVDGLAAMMDGALKTPKPDGVHVSEFVLYNTPRIDKIEDKAGFSAWKEDRISFISKDSEAIDIEDVIDITATMQPDGSITWKAPIGNWNVVRFGYSLTGRQNHPASPEATGLEVDKLDSIAVSKYINTYLDMYKDATGGLMGEKGLGYMILDSYEAGHMNWTKNFPEEFKNRRGYSIYKWIPALTGRIIKSAEASEKFLWDFRKTIGEMIAENHYDVIGEELHKRGMKRYTESHENGRIYLADGMDVKQNADIPMSAMWTPGSLAGGSDEEVRSEGDIRESASVANIYGKPFVAAESMTSIQNAFSWHPEKLKRTADLELASGLNRFVIHTSVHQPLDDKMPGFSLGPFGQYFTRHETWSGAGAKAWISYLSRSSYLLQQGQNVADVLYYYGENTNITWVCRESLPKLPKGLEFDFVNASILKEDILAKDEKLVAPSGATYQVLVLDESAKDMTLDVLKKISAFQNAGVKVAGTKPANSPSLSDDAEVYKRLVAEVSSKMVSIEELNITPDITISGTDHKILFKHRQGAGKDIYWLNNRSDNATGANISFNITGKRPQLWNPQTGMTEKVSYQFKNGRTIIPLQFESWDAYFIVFEETTSEEVYEKPVITQKEIVRITTPWEVAFQENRGAPATATFSDLTSWSDNNNEGIKYFSGTASYTNSFKIDGDQLKSGAIVINLGNVKNVAEVIVNGLNMGTLWKTPFTLDITEALKTGNNTLELKITNLWVNRLIGDAQPDVKEKSTFTTMPFYTKDDTLLPSGLLGPVTLLKKHM